MSSTQDESTLRHRTPWSGKSLLNSDVPGIKDLKDLLEEDDSSSLVEEDGAGCPLPSTPEDQLLLDSEVILWLLRVFFCFAYF